jgi:hypothetical protein
MPAPENKEKIQGWPIEVAGYELTSEGVAAGDCMAVLSDCEAVATES